MRAWLLLRKNKMTTPELDNITEIERLLSSDLQSKRDEGTGKALIKVTLGIVNTRLAISGLHSAIGSIRERMDTLNKNLQEADKTSSKLTTALNRITLAGVVIAALGIVIALGNLWISYQQMRSSDAQNTPTTSLPKQ